MAGSNDHNATMIENLIRGVTVAGAFKHFAMQEAWDRASATYLERRGDRVDAVAYGNLAPTDLELGLLGELRGLRVLDLGCGGGHNAVACALVGAQVVGVDLSKTQLLAAQALADEHDVVVAWHHAGGLSLEGLVGVPFDLVLAIQVLPYVEEPAALLHAIHALVRPGGRLVVSIDHPLRNCFFDAEMDEFTPYPARSYFDNDPIEWRFEPDVPMVAHHQPLGQWVEWLLEAGWQLRRLIEAPAPQTVCDELWPEDSPLSPLRMIPHTAILVAQVPAL